MNSHRYILITAAYNEEDNIEKTILSVTAQTLVPVLWIIVSDGSTDGTDEIIKRYEQDHSFISYIRKSDKDRHSFGAKVDALNDGISRIGSTGHDFIGILDADVSLEQDYFQQLLEKFEANEKLGIAGGNIIEFVDGKYHTRFKSFNSVAGAVQLFRKECLADTDGFKPCEYGGEDAAVEITARMKGWEVRTFPELEVVHHGHVGGKSGNRLRTRFRNGMSMFSLGYHPLFQMFRIVRNMAVRPYIFGSLWELAGYINAKIRDRKSRLPAETVAFLRKEQLNRLKRLFPLSR